MERGSIKVFHFHNGRQGGVFSVIHNLLKYSKIKDKEVPSEKIDLTQFIEVKGMKAKGNKLSYAKVKDISLLPPVEVPIDEDVLDEFEESGMSPLEAIKKAQEPAKDKNLISIDQQINQQIKLPSQEKKKKPKKGKGGGKDLRLDF